MDDPDIAAHMARQRGLITAPQAVASGLTSTEIRRRRTRDRWVKLRTGVYVEAEQWAAADDFTEKPRLRIWAAHLVLQRPHHFSHDSAAVLQGVPLIDARSSLVHVTRGHVHGGRIDAGIKHHLAPFHPEEATTVDGLRVLGLPRTVVDVARENGLVAGVAAVDNALRRGVTKADLLEVLGRMPCWPGNTVVRRSIELGDAGAETLLESASRILLTELGLGRPDTQFGLTDGTRTVWCDLRIGRWVVEPDGWWKYRPVARGGLARVDPDQVLREEKIRQDFITGFKIGVSRLTWADVFVHPEQTKRRLLREYEQTVRLFGTDLSDLAPFIVRRRRGA